MDNTKKLQTLSLCTGYGGIERGLELAGESLRTLAHVEIEAFACANLVAKMEEGKLGAAPIWTDLKTLPAHVFRDAVDVLTGGYPCQPFSAAGKRQGADDPRHLWPHICRIIDEVRPRRCFFENVEGHISLGLREVLADLEARGYSTAWGIFSASEVGAIHQRKRIFILAYSDSKGLEGGKRWAKDRLFSLDQFFTLEGQFTQNKDELPKPYTFGGNDGPSNRVDRLRLLGNGVVPQTAALAWRTLNNNISD